MTNPLSRAARIAVGLCIVVLLAVANAALAQEAAVKSFSDAIDPQHVKPNDRSEGEVTFAVANGGIDVTVAANGKSSYPGIKITPSPAWDASGFGHIEAKVTNNGAKPIRVNLRIDNEGPWQENRYSATVVGVKPGETKVVSAIFGYTYGKAAYKLDPKAISAALIFIGKSDVEQKFKVEAIQAAGPADEKPFVDPNHVALKPAGGVILGGDAPPLTEKNFAAVAGAKATPAADGKSVTLDFPAGKPATVTFKPVAGMWNLNRHLQVRVKFKNTDTSPVTPTFQLASRGGHGGRGDLIEAPTAIAPGVESEIVLPFKPLKPWIGADLPEMRDGLATKEVYDKAIQEAKGGATPGTGTKFASNTANGILISVTPSSGPAQLQITSVIADMPERQPLPDWLGKRPPVTEGEWTQTFDENFDGDTINLNTWNIYSSGAWHIGSQTAYSKDNLIVKDGKLTLRVEKREVHHNDDPQYAKFQYATGNADSYGKWTQRYGYFEARVKLADAPNIFPAFWLMPDRGKDWKPTAKGDDKAGQRNDTKDGGMEFDIMEQLSIWGPYRHDFGMHWDGYMKYHKAIGTFTCYFQPDAEGFLTVGMLWTPGEVVMYQQGQESARWKTDRISIHPAYFILQNVTGGWETEGFDDTTLPADGIYDYVRAWQRTDLASPADGPKENSGNPIIGAK